MPDASVSCFQLLPVTVSHLPDVDADEEPARGHAGRLCLVERQPLVLEVGSGQVRLGQVRQGKARSGKAGQGKVRRGQARSGQVREGKVR
jgi:hypothetical protein